MPNQSTSGAIWSDQTAGGNPAVRAHLGVIVQVAPNRYEIRETGTAAASLVARTYGYEIVPGNLTGTGVIAVIGARAVIY